MVAKSKGAEAPTEIDILEITTGRAEFMIVGTSPLIFNRMAEKAKRTLLLGGTKKTAADKAANLKHEPIEEYRASVYRNTGDECLTRLKLPAPAFKGAMKTAALDMPGTKKTEIGRLCWVMGTHVDVYGAPQLLMSVVRSADMNKTPDIRTRAILPRWACRITVAFVQPKLTGKAIVKLMAASGVICGVGDNRQEKGSGSYGQFRCASADDTEFQQIVADGGRAVQDDALHHYECYDEETDELLSWYSSEIIRLGRGKKDAA